MRGKKERKKGKREKWGAARREGRGDQLAEDKEGLRKPICVQTRMWFISLVGQGYTILPSKWAGSPHRRFCYVIFFPVGHLSAQSMPQSVMTYRTTWAKKSLRVCLTLLRKRERNETRVS